MSQENGTPKLTSVDYVRDEVNIVLKKNFGSNTNWGTSVASGDDKYWDYYLNNTWLTSELQLYITEGTYYLGIVVDASYKNAICSTSNTTERTSNCSRTTSTWTGLVGLPRVGEMFSAMLGKGYKDTSTYIWLITPRRNDEVWTVYSNGRMNFYSPSSTLGVRPSINLKPEVKITGGEGTEQSPYTIGL